MSEWLRQTLETSMSSGSAMVYLLVFAGGIVAGFTPCIYPVLPLTVGYVGGAARGRKGHAFLLSLSLVLGMALVYAVIGTIFAAVGIQFGAIWANGWAVFAIAWFFILMSLFLMDVFPFPLPRFLQNLRARTGARQGILGAFIVGGISGLVVGPCTGPILAVVLVAVATTLQHAEGAAFILQALNGGLKLFLFGLGQGTLILLCGTFAGFLALLPKSGKWMVTVKKGFALLILIGASLILVFVGQATDFPELTRLLAGAEGAASAGATPSDAQSAQAPQPPTTANAPGKEPFEMACALPPKPGFEALIAPLLNPEQAEGPMAPDFTLTADNGQNVTLSRFRGKSGIVLVFFATWCPSCIEEVPQIKQFASRGAGENVEVFGINVQQSKRIVDRFIRAHEVNYRILLDTEARVARAYGATGMPTVIGIDAAGVIRHFGHSLPPDTKTFIATLTAPMIAGKSAEKKE